MKQDSTFLMANLGSEVTRLLQARGEKNVERMKGAHDRGCKILDSMTMLPDMESRKKELDIVREVMDDFMLEKPKLAVHQEFLKNYFLPFALKAMSV